MGGRKNVFWTPERDDMLRRLIGSGKSVADASDAIGRSQDSVCRRMQAIGLMPANKRSDYWSSANIELLRDLWDKGLSCSDIAAQIGGLTRNAVIGKASRLGLPSRASGSTRHQAASRLRRDGTVRKAKPRPLVFSKSGMLLEQSVNEKSYDQREPDLVIPPEHRKTLVDLEPTDCRWPFGDPSTPEFHFCGHVKVPGLPYCEFHARRAFQPPQPRRRTHHQAAAARKEEVPA